MQIPVNPIARFIPALSTSERYVIILIVMVIGLFLAIGITLTIKELNVALRQINMEINRTHGSEKRHYQKKKRKLILSIIFPWIKK